jgi:hypothetical protein
MSPARMLKGESHLRATASLPGAGFDLSPDPYSDHGWRFKAFDDP